VRTARSGREYLLDRARELREERAIAEDLSRAVAGEVTEIRGLATRGGERRLACLVPEHRISEFQDAVEGWSRLRQEHVWCTGPWPPFSFAEEVERD
jgi:hypothetical protein